MKTLKQNLLLIIISLFFYSCFIDDYGTSDSNIKFITYWKNDIFDSQDFSNTIFVNNDTLSLKN